MLIRIIKYILLNITFDVPNLQCITWTTTSSAMQYSMIILKICSYDHMDMISRYNIYKLSILPYAHYHKITHYSGKYFFVGPIIQSEITMD